MGKYSVPANIRAMKPKGTMAKIVDGKYYYAYSYTTIVGEDGKQHTKMGKNLGKLDPVLGFVPNENYLPWYEARIKQEKSKASCALENPGAESYSPKNDLPSHANGQGEEVCPSRQPKQSESSGDGSGGAMPKPVVTKKEITVCEYGQYAITFNGAKAVLSKLLDSFGKDDAYRIFIIASIHFVNRYTYIKCIPEVYAQSCYPFVFPTLKMGTKALDTLYDTLGRCQNSVHGFESELIRESSGEMILDGHAIKACSVGNDLADYGNKYKKTKEMQVNLLMAMDARTMQPLLSRMFNGGILDKVGLKELLKIHDLKNTFFIVDRGFYSDDNIRYLSSNGNTYIMPLSSNLSKYKKAVESMTFKNRFVFTKGKKRHTIEWKCVSRSRTKHKIYVFRDINQNATDNDSYKKKQLQMGTYSEEQHDQLRDFFGVIVLQTNREGTAEEHYSTYKARWGIETFYDYLKNKVDYNELYIEDYYKMQGLAFIMLVEACIHHEMSEKFKNTSRNGITLDDALLEARGIKAVMMNGEWQISAIKEKTKTLFELFGSATSQPLMLGEHRMLLSQKL